MKTTTNNPCETFAMRIKELRGKTPVSKIARSIGIKPVEYTAYENAEREPTLSHLTAIASVFNTSTDYLLGLSTSRQPFVKEAANVVSRIIAIEAEAQKKRVALYEEIQGVTR